MAIKITLKRLIDAGTTGALTRYFALDKPVAVAWKNRAQLAACEEAINKHYNDARIALCKKHGRLDAETNQYLFEGEGVDAAAKENFEKDLLVLWAEEVEIPGEPVKVSTIAGSIKESDLQILESFLVD
jgi:endonuclease V-like protein UPF0215 family